MYSEIEHIFFASMSNPELFLIKDGKEESSNFEILQRPTLKFQTECHESLISSSSESQLEKEGEEKEERSRKTRIVLSKLSDSEASAPSSREQLQEEDEEDGCRTPTSLEHRIPVAKQCPPAPRKPKPSLKRKANHSPCGCRHPPDLSKEVELLFPIQRNPFSDPHQSTKKVRREEPK